MNLLSTLYCKAFLREIAEEERDLIMEYWQSEHHRFEYGQFSDVLTQLDPLSYHQMGLAVPGSFLEKCKNMCKWQLI